MEYANRLPGIGGLLEITKSKKGMAFIIAIVVLLGGGIAGVENGILITVAGMALSYIGGQSFVDGKRQANELNTEVNKVLEIVQPREETA